MFCFNHASAFYTSCNIVEMLINNKFKAQNQTGNPVGNNRCQLLASRALNTSCSFSQSACSIESRCVVKFMGIYLTIWLLVYHYNPPRAVTLPLCVIYRNSVITYSNCKSTYWVPRRNTVIVYANSCELSDLIYTTNSRTCHNCHTRHIHITNAKPQTNMEFILYNNIELFCHEWFRFN